MQDARTTTSPEVTAKKQRKSLFFRVALYFLRPFIYRFKTYYLRKKWAHHSDPRSLDFDWGIVNYNRVAVVNLLLFKFNDPCYLEIGCASDELFNSVPTLKKLGVDPSSVGNVRKTSDDFFESNDTSFDVVFIDGLHTYEQVRRDVINSIKSLNKGGWIALHDMLPRNWLEHHVPIITQGAWTGDVWKIAFELVKTQGIEFKILKVDHGVGVIRVLDTKATLPDLKSDLLHQEFAYYFNNIKELPIVEWKDAQDWLRL